MNFVDRTWADQPIVAKGLWNYPQPKLGDIPPNHGQLATVGTLPQVRPVPVPFMEPAALGRARIPDPETIEHQKLNLARELDNQLAEGSRSIADNLEAGKLRLRQELQEMGICYAGHLDYVAAQLRKSIEQQARQQHQSLAHVARDWKQLFAPQMPHVAADPVTQSLVGGNRDFQMAAIEHARYSKGVEGHLVIGEHLIGETVQLQKYRLDQAVLEQRRLHAAQLDRIAVHISLRMEQLAQQQYLHLFRHAQHQKSLLEQQACSLTMEYLHREMQGKMAHNQVESQEHLRRQLQMLNQDAMMKPLTAMLQFSPDGLLMNR